jgi:flagellar basal body-associated protein FliL
MTENEIAVYIILACIWAVGAVIILTHGVKQSDAAKRNARLAKFREPKPMTEIDGAQLLCVLAASGLVGAVIGAIVVGWR